MTRAAAGSSVPASSARPSGAPPGLGARTKDAPQASESRPIGAPPKGDRPVGTTRFPKKSATTFVYSTSGCNDLGMTVGLPFKERLNMSPTEGTARRQVSPCRIPLISSPSDLAFSFKRLQFPVRLCFAMSINKSQGQTLKVAGLQLQEPCFSHGQLYVACSRVGSSNNLFTLCQAHKKCRSCNFQNCGAHFHKTVNTVYRSALE